MEPDQFATLNEKKRPRVHFDDVLAVVGSFGRYQKLMAFLVILPALIPSGFLDWSLVFFTNTPAAYMCSIPESNFSNSYLTARFLDGAGRKFTKEEKCCERDFNHPEWCSGLNNASTWTTCHHEVLYDRSEYEETVVTEWDLVCDLKDLTSTARTLSAVGGLFGPMIWSFMADRIGRKKGFFLCVVFQSVFAIMTGWAPSYIWFCVFRFCTGMTTSASYTIPYDILLEISGTKSRGLLSILASTSYTIGCLIFVLIAYYIRAWRTLAFATAVPSAILYCLVFYFFPESPRWLLSQRSYPQLATYLCHIARVNRRPLTADFQTNLPTLLRGIDTERHGSKHSFFDLLNFRQPNMLKKTMILVALNICNKGVSRGLNQFAPDLHSNPYLSVFLTIVVGLPALLIAKPVFDHFGRRFLLIVPLLVGSIACMSTAIQSSVPGLILGLSLVAKFCINFTYLTGKLVEGEIFPTVVRSEGHSLVSILSSVAVWPVPFIVRLGLDYQLVPLMVFGSLCFVVAFLVFFLPETAGQRLPQTLEDGENFGKQTPWKERFRLFGRLQHQPDSEKV